MTTKTIGIDARAALHPQAGKGRYTLEVVKAALNQGKNVDFVLFTDSAPLFPDSTDPHLRQVILRGKSIFWHINLYFYLRKNPVTFFLAPTSYIYPALAPASQKVAIIIHDLITFLHPKRHPFFPTLVERLTLPRAIKKAAQIFCVSENTKKDLLHLFSAATHSAAKKKIAIAYPAVSEEFHSVTTHKMSLPDDFILAVGTLPRKNVDTLIKAFLSTHVSTLHLCVVGQMPPRTVPGHEKIHFLGQVNSAELRELYSRARMLVFPSLYEGFGMPPLEAMACGCPVIVSNISSLPEVVGEAAIKVDPRSPAQIAEAIKKLLNLAARKSYQSEGILQVKKFSWEKTAKTILETLQVTILGRKSNL
ncbi:MAG: glycosyltransferase family 1 protein [Candidatus Gracilibacteria bacterium]|jgi:glycosyltransferase involved in cell wall biosynthesis